MSISNVSGASIAAQIFATMKETSNQIEQASDELADAAIDAEYGETMNAAQLERDAAEARYDAEMKAAIGKAASGGVKALLAGGGAVAIAGSDTSDASQLSLKGTLKLMDVGSNAADGLGGLNDMGVAGDKRDAGIIDSRATEAEARAKKHGHSATQAMDASRDAKKLRDSGKEILKEVLDHEHASKMAALRLRG